MQKIYTIYIAEPHPIFYKSKRNPPETQKTGEQLLSSPPVSLPNFLYANYSLQNFSASVVRLYIKSPRFFTMLSNKLRLSNQLSGGVQRTSSRFCDTFNAHPLNIHEGISHSVSRILNNEKGELFFFTFNLSSSESNHP